MFGVWSVGEADEDFVSNGVTRIAEWNGVEVGLFESVGKVVKFGTHAEDEGFRFFSHFWRIEVGHCVSERGRVKTVGKEPGSVGGATNGAGVDCHFDGGKVGDPVVGMEAANAELLGDYGINALNSAVGTRMESNGRCRFNGKERANVNPKLGGNASVAVGANDSRNAVVANDFANEELCHLERG